MLTELIAITVAKLVSHEHRLIGKQWERYVHELNRIGKVAAVLMLGAAIPLVALVRTKAA